MSLSRQSVFVVAIFGAAMLMVGAGALFISTRAVSIDTADLPVPGFVGTAAFGDWEFICTPRVEMAPPLVSFELLDSGPDLNQDATAIVETTCRLHHEVLAQSGEDSEPSVILAVYLGLVGLSESPVLMLRLPPTLTEGDMVVLRSRDNFEVETLARVCSVEECVATSTLSEDEWEQLVGANSLQVVFRVDSVQLVSIDVSTFGLRESYAALEATQVQEPL
jgi:invasion protein IalB